MGLSQAVYDALFTWQTLPAFLVFMLVQSKMMRRHDWRIAYTVAITAAVLVLGFLLWISGETGTILLQTMGVFAVVTVVVDLLTWKMAEL